MMIKKHVREWLSITLLCLSLLWPSMRGGAVLKSRVLTSRRLLKFWLSWLGLIIWVINKQWCVPYFWTVYVSSQDIKTEATEPQTIWIHQTNKDDVECRRWCSCELPRAARGRCCSRWLLRGGFTCSQEPWRRIYTFQLDKEANRVSGNRGSRSSSPNIRS